MLPETYNTHCEEIDLMLNMGAFYLTTREIILIMKKRSTNEQNSISINDHKNYKLQIIHHNNNLKYIASHQKKLLLYPAIMMS